MELENNNEIETPEVIEMTPELEALKSLYNKEEEVAVEPVAETPPEAVPTETQEEQISQEDYKKLKEELETLKSTPNKAEVDVEWFKSDEGKLFMRDLDGLNLDDNAIELMVEKTMKDNGYSREDAEEEVEYKFKLLFEEDPETDSREYKAEYRQLTSEASKYLNSLKEEKAKIEAPFTKPSEKGQIAPDEFEKVYSERAIKEYQDRSQARAMLADDLLKGRETTQLKFGDVELSYELKPEVAAKIKADLVELENIGNQFVDEKSGVLKDDLFEFLLFKNDKQTLLDSYAGIKSAEGREKLIKDDIKNVNFQSKSPSNSVIGYSEDHPLYGAATELARMKGN